MSGDCGVYKIRNVKTNEEYVGSTMTIQSRMRYHMSMLRRNVHANQSLQRAWNEFGEEAFIFEILEICEASNLIKREQHYIDAYLQLGVKLYNKEKVASNSGNAKSIDTRVKISQSLTGKSKSPEHAAKMAERNRSTAMKEAASRANKGIPKSKEHIAKIKQSILSNPEEVERRRLSSAKAREALAAKHARGEVKPMSEETKAKISATKAGNKLSPEHKARIGAASKLSWAKRKTD